MSLRVVVLQHERETGLGSFAGLLDAADIDYDVVETLRGPLPHAARSAARSRSAPA